MTRQSFIPEHVMHRLVVLVGLQTCLVIPTRWLRICKHSFLQQMYKRIRIHIRNDFARWRIEAKQDLQCQQWGDTDNSRIP